MRIQQRRIKDPSAFLGALPAGSKFQVILTDIETHTARLQQIGFSPELRPGELLLPKQIGSISRYNADGKDVPQRDQPRETVYRLVYSNVFGRGHQYVNRAYERYPRLHFNAPSEQLQIDVTNGKKVVVSRELEYKPGQTDDNKHVINLFLEIFGQCDIQSELLVQLHQIQIEIRNWQMLPPGDYPWERAKDVLIDVTRTLSPAKRAVVDARFQLLSNYVPNGIVVGQGGFDGYVAFRFEEKNLYILESRHTNNATYVFGDDWEGLSQLTKSEILHGGLNLHRIIHNDEWADKIILLLEGNPVARQAA